MKIRIKWIVILLIAINSILVGLQDVKALPVGYSLGTFNGEKTIISDTGLEWIDPTIFNNLTQTGLEATLNPGGLYEAFNLASHAEVSTLLDDYGIQFDPTLIAAGNSMLFADLNSFFEGTTELINGRTSDPVGGAFHVVVQNANIVGSPAQRTAFEFADSASSPTIGAWANRQTTVLVPDTPVSVPEPGTSIMVGLGFVALFVFQRKTRTNS